MPAAHSRQLDLALHAFHRGRFVEAVNLLSDLERLLASPEHAAAKAVLADALQRTGQNEAAERLAESRCRDRSQPSAARARYHFVLANIQRERGYQNEALKHLYLAAELSAADPEMMCWIELRLMMTIAQISGWEAVTTKIDTVARTLARNADRRPFAAFHLWFVEMDTVRGELERATRHLKIATALLEDVDDAWLSGYLFVNTSVLNFYSANIIDAKVWAERAVEQAELSGHWTTRRAAHTNLGYFYYISGDGILAEEHFNRALECCEPGSASAMAILDNLAEAKLQSGDLEGCRDIVSLLERLTRESTNAQKKHYSVWALQTRARLSLKTGSQSEAERASEAIGALLETSPHARLNIESRLLNSETRLETAPDHAAELLLPIIFAHGTALPPDLFAEAERILGESLQRISASCLGAIHLDRAARLFQAIGHKLGYRRIPSHVVTRGGDEYESATPQVITDRFRALIDLRSRPELLGYEALELLRDLRCGDAATLTVRTSLVETDHAAGRISVALGDTPRGALYLSFVVRSGLSEMLTALNFERIIKWLVTTPTTDPTRDREIVWTCSNVELSRNAVFASDAMLSVLKTINRIAPTNVSVLVTGETGSGKEVVARAIHDQSTRAIKPFAALNCASVPRDLLESQLFGHRRGAFSGAIENYPGIVRSANGGTLFLDEVGELPLEAQAKLLRFLESGEVHPVGEPRPIKVDVRLIFATNQDLEECVRQQRFRQDLYYRLSVVPIDIPPLRERREEIPALVAFFAQRVARELERDPLEFATQAMQQLIFYSWPGNVRQLSNEVRRLAALLPPGTCVTVSDLSKPIRECGATTMNRVGATTSTMKVRTDGTLSSAVDELETAMIRQALRNARGRVSDAAASLGISRKGLYLKRLRLGLIDPLESE